jgi:hypothetical protein
MGYPDMTALEWIGAAFLAVIVIGSLLYKPRVCAICDGPMVPVGNGNKLLCLDCGRTGVN